MMTLDEAIQHCQEKSCDNTGCAKDHQQLGEWLTELKHYREKSKKRLSDREFIERLQLEIDTRLDSIKTIASDWARGQREILFRLKEKIDDHLDYE